MTPVLERKDAGLEEGDGESGNEKLSEKSKEVELEARHKTAENLCGNHGGAVHEAGYHAGDTSEQAVRSWRHSNTPPRHSVNTGCVLKLKYNEYKL